MLQLIVIRLVLSIGTSAVSGFTYAWTPTTGLSSSTVAQPTATPNTTTTYSLVITNSSTGCTASDTVVVTVDNATPTANAGSDATIDCNTTSAEYWNFSRIRVYLRLDTNYRTVFLHSSTTDSNTNSTTTYSLVITNLSTGCSSAPIR